MASGRKSLIAKRLERISYLVKVAKHDWKDVVFVRSCAEEQA